MKQPGPRYRALIIITFLCIGCSKKLVLINEVRTDGTKLYSSTKPKKDKAVWLDVQKKTDKEFGQVVYFIDKDSCEAMTKKTFSKGLWQIYRFTAGDYFDLAISDSDKVMLKKLLPFIEEKNSCRLQYIDKLTGLTLYGLRRTVKNPR